MVENQKAFFDQVELACRKRDDFERILRDNGFEVLVCTIGDVRFTDSTGIPITIEVKELWYRTKLVEGEPYDKEYQGGFQNTSNWIWKTENDQEIDFLGISGGTIYANREAFAEYWVFQKKDNLMIGYRFNYVPTMVNTDTRLGVLTVKEYLSREGRACCENG
jgi:hypothetical protein